MQANFAAHQPGRLGGTTKFGHGPSGCFQNFGMAGQAHVIMAETQVLGRQYLKVGVMLAQHFEPLRRPVTSGNWSALGPLVGNSLPAARGQSLHPARLNFADSAHQTTILIEHHVGCGAFFSDLQGAHTRFDQAGAQLRLQSDLAHGVGQNRSAVLTLHPNREL